MSTTETKTCPRCKKEKPLNGFYSDRRAKDGLQSECSRCHNLAGASWYERNKESLRQERMNKKQEASHV